MNRAANCGNFVFCRTHQEISRASSSLRRGCYRRAGRSREPIGFDVGFTAARIVENTAGASPPRPDERTSSRHADISDTAPRRVQHAPCPIRHRGRARAVLPVRDLRGNAFPARDRHEGAVSARSALGRARLALYRPLSRAGHSGGPGRADPGTGRSGFGQTGGGARNRPRAFPLDRRAARRSVLRAQRAALSAESGCGSRSPAGWRRRRR